MCPGFRWRLNSWRVKVHHSAPPRNLFVFKPFHYCTCSAPFPPTPFPVFLPHITSLPAHKTRMIGHDGVLPPTILCEHASQVALAPSRGPTHLLHQNKMSFFLFLFSVLSYFLFNPNRCRTMVATTSPPSPHVHAGSNCTDPVASTSNTCSCHQP